MPINHDGLPLYYLSQAQRPILSKIPKLKKYGARLPFWVPHREVALALRNGDRGVTTAKHRFGPYRWAIEFENVHTTWRFAEPGFSYGSLHFRGAE